MDPAPLLLAICEALGTAFMMALAGMVATWQGFITDDFKTKLAGLSMNVLMPALLFASVVQCKSSEGESCPPFAAMIDEAWILLVLPFFVVGSGIALGWIVCVTTRCPSSFWKACIGAVAFANSSGMPITLLGVLGPVLQASGVLHTDPLKYQPVYVILYPILQWSIGSYLFGLPGCGQQSAAAAQPGGTSEPARTMSGPLASQGHLFGLLGSRAQSSEAAEPALLVGTAEDEEQQELDVERAYGADSFGHASGSPSGCRRRVACFASGLIGLVRQALVPPVLGALLGIAVAAVPQVHGLFVDVEGSGQLPPLEFCFLAVHTLGKAVVPMNMLLMGSNMAKGGDLRSIPFRTNVGVILMRQLCQPVLMGVLIYVLAPVVRGVRNPSIALVMVIVSCTPTANNVMLMVELSGQDKQAMTACIFSQYLTAPISLVVVLATFLMLPETLGYMTFSNQ